MMFKHNKPKTKLNKVLKRQKILLEGLCPIGRQDMAINIHAAASSIGTKDQCCLQRADSDFFLYIKVVNFTIHCLLRDFASGQTLFQI